MCGAEHETGTVWQTEAGAARTQGYAALGAVLQRQCRIGPAEGAALIRFGRAAHPELLASHPPIDAALPPPPWLGAALDKVRDAQPLDRPLLLPSGGPGRESVAIVPVAGDHETARVCGAYLLAAHLDNPSIVVERLVLTMAALQVAELHRECSRQAGEIERLRRTLSTLTGIAGHNKFGAAAMALCNHVSAEWNCERVCLGLVSGQYVRLTAMSHTEKLVRSSPLARDIEATMEECLDQDVEVLAPAEPDEAALNRAARELSARHGPIAVCSVPFRREGRPVGVLTMERSLDAPFEPAEVASLRLLADAASAQVWLTHRHRRSLWASIGAALREGSGLVVGPRHTWAKLSALVVLGAIIFFLLVPGTYRVRGDARVEAAERRIVAAPFDGFLRQAHAKVGDEVSAGAELASLDPTDLLLKLTALRADHDGALREAALAQRERKDAEAQIARARARRAEAEIEFLERQVEQATVRAPMDGVIVAGELERVVGAPVSTGDRLFEVAPVDSLLVEVFVEEDQIADVRAGSKGWFAAASNPDIKIPLTAERIDPVAELRESRNVFRVRAALEEKPSWLRPGMEGVVRFDAGERSYPWIWTRRAVNWVRMKLWI